MGKRKEQNGQYHHTHVAYFRNMKNSKNSILLIENVTEYKEDLVKKELGPEWTLVSIRMDPRCLGLPCSRARVFMVCWKVKEVRWTAPFTLYSFVGALCSRVVMNAGHYFWKKSTNKAHKERCPLTEGSELESLECRRYSHVQCTAGSELECLRYNHVVITRE